jgi:TRAP-type uncharacterized transport system substrate-binding protein
MSQSPRAAPAPSRTRRLLNRVVIRPLSWTRLVSWRQWLLVGVPIAIAVAIGLWVAATLVQPAPPRRVTMATGPEAGAYAAFGEQYRALLAEDRVTLDLRPTAGARENWKLIGEDANAAVDIALIRGGIGTPEEAPHLESLGVVSYEALWVFCRGKAMLDDLPALRGRTIAIGAKGAGTRRLVRKLLGANGIGDDDFTALEIGGVEAATALLEGRADCIVLLEPPEAGLLKALIYSPDAQLVDFSRRADAYTKLLPFLTKVVLPEGANDLEDNRPPKPVTLLAAQTELVVRDTLHPAIRTLLLQAAAKVHSGVGMFNADREFPALRTLDFPLAEEALRFHAGSRPFLQRWLPFWVANLVDRLIVFLVPMIAIALPLVRVLPPLYAWSVRRRIYRWYGELMYIENEMLRDLSTGETTDFAARLDWIEHEVHQLHPPLAYAHQLYQLRQHIDFVQDKLGLIAQRAQDAPDAVPVPATRAQGADADAVGGAAAAGSLDAPGM